MSLPVNGCFNIRRRKRKAKKRKTCHCNNFHLVKTVKTCAFDIPLDLSQSFQEMTFY